MSTGFCTGFSGRLFAATATAISLSLVLSAQQGPSARVEAPIRLKGATFTPARGEQPSIPPGLAIAGYPEGLRGYFIVKISVPELA
jgi:hypothetical protein